MAHPTCPGTSQGPQDSEPDPGGSWLQLWAEGRNQGLLLALTRVDTEPETSLGPLGGWGHAFPQHHDTCLKKCH